MKETPNSVTVGSIWRLSERFLSQGIAFLVSLILARLLTPEDYGIVSITLVFINLADVLVVNGFGNALIRKKDADELDFSSVFYCTLAISVAVYLLLFFIAPTVGEIYDEPTLSPILRVFALRLPIGALNSIQHAYVARKMIFRKYFFSTLGGSLASGVVGVAMAIYGFGVWAIVGQYLSGTVVSTVVLLFTVSWRPRALFSLRAAKPLIRFGWKITATSFLGVLFAQLRSLMIGKVYTEAELAYYDRGRNFSTLATDNVGNALLSVLFPALSRVGDDSALLKEKLRAALRIISFVVLPASVGLAVVASPLIRLLLTEKWVDCIPFVQLLSFATSISMLGDVSLQALNAKGRSDTVLKLELFLKRPIFLLLLIVGLKISVLAVAVSTLVYSVCSTLINLPVLKKHLGYTATEQLHDLLPSVALSGAMALAASLWLLVPTPTALRLVLQVTTGAAVYLSLAALTKNTGLAFIWRAARGLLLKKRGD